MNSTKQTTSAKSNASSKTAKTLPSKSKAASNDDDEFIGDEALSGGSSYFKPEDGENSVRIIGGPIFGFVGWEGNEKDGRTPVRTRLEDGPPEIEFTEKKDAPKKFMAVVVIDKSDEEVKIWEVTQQSIIKAIKALAANPKWGKPFAYDLDITKSGESLKTRYVVTPNPKEPVSKQLMAVAAEKPCNLEALYEGEDPWAEESLEAGATEYRFK